jgi:hypothetical protein
LLGKIIREEEAQRRSCGSMINKKLIDLTSVSGKEILGHGSADPVDVRRVDLLRHEVTDIGIVGYDSHHTKIIPTGDSLRGLPSFVES